MEHLDTAQEKHRREIDTKESFQEVGPHVRIPPKFLWIEPFHRNFVGFQDGQSFVPKGHIGKIPIGL
jgi:hypothetical protein